MKSMMMGVDFWGELNGDVLTLETETKRVRFELDAAGVVWLAGQLQDWLDQRQAAIDRARAALQRAGSKP